MKITNDFESLMRCFAVLGKDGHVGVGGVECTPDDMAERYEKANCYLLYNPPVGIVMNITVETEEGLLWESFANVDGDERHWIHYEFPKWENGREWSQSFRSPDKPDEVIGKKWFAYRVPDMTPYLCQRGERRTV